MKSAKRILAVLLCAALLISVLCACGKTADTGADTDTNDDSVAQQLYDADVAAPDLTNATEITLSGADNVTITDGGVYVLTGTLTDGRVLINAPGADVTLVLRDADITCVDSSALYIYKAASVLVYLPDGAASTLTDGSSYDYSDSFSSTADEEPNACLYSKSDLVIAGGGTGAPCFRQLAREGTPFATGVLHEHDADGLLARSLAARAIFERDFEPVSPGALVRAREVLLACCEVICCVDAFGTGNARNAELLDAARAAGIPVRHAGLIQLPHQDGDINVAAGQAGDVIGEDTYGIPGMDLLGQQPGPNGMGQRVLHDILLRANAGGVLLGQQDAEAICCERGIRNRP